MSAIYLISVKKEEILTIRSYVDYQSKKKCHRFIIRDQFVSLLMYIRAQDLHV
jgi:hypothetical protein